MNKAGYSVRVDVSVVNKNGKTLSTTSHNMYGFDNPTADKIAEDAVMKLAVAEQVPGGRGRGDEAGGSGTRSPERKVR